jgi:hypothetical protein
MANDKYYGDLATKGLLNAGNDLIRTRGGKREILRKLDSAHVGTSFSSGGWKVRMHFMRDFAESFRGKEEDEIKALYDNFAASGGQISGGLFTTITRAVQIFVLCGHTQTGVDSQLAFQGVPVTDASTPHVLLIIAALESQTIFSQLPLFQRVPHSRPC